MAAIYTYSDGEPYRPRPFHDWLDQPAKFGREFYLPGEFVPCWDQLYGNDTELYVRRRDAYFFTPDEMKLKYHNLCWSCHDFILAGYKEHVAINRPSIELEFATHFTDDSGYDGIRDRKFIYANPKYLHESVVGQGREENYSFVWFTATVGTKGVEIVQNSIRDRRHEIYHYHPFCEYEYQREFNFDSNNYATSTPFTSTDHPCGGRGFTIPMGELIDYYCRKFNMQRCKFRCLGTFVYKKEVMYAVVAHPPIASTNILKSAEINFFSQFPELKRDGDSNPATVVYMQNNRLFWKPFSTSSIFLDNDNRPRYCRWDQVALAFYFPEGYDGFNLANIDGWSRF